MRSAVVFAELSEALLGHDVRNRPHKPCTAGPRTEVTVFSFSRDNRRFYGVHVAAGETYFSDGVRRKVQYRFGGFGF